MGDRGTDAAPGGPIFVGGTIRSGKTLVRWLLSSHSRIVVTRRTEMWTRFFGRFGDLAEPRNLERCLAAMLARRHIAELEPDPVRLRRDFRSGPPTYGRLFALVHEHYAARVGKPRWGDQSGSIERMADEIFSELRQARFLHLVRDPRDVFAAQEARRARRAGAAGGIAAAWLSSASLAERNRRRYDGRYLVLRYEDLVRHPETTMRRVCDHLEEAFEPAMMRMDGVGRYNAVRTASDGGSPISTAFVGQYRGSVDRSDLAFIQTVAADRMRALGYPLDPIRLTPSERFRYAATWPVSRARMRRSA